MSAENKGEKHTSISFFVPSPVKEGKEEKIERKEEYAKINTEKQILASRIEQLDWVLGDCLSVFEVEELFRNHYFLQDDSNDISALREKLSEIKSALDSDIEKARLLLKEIESNIDKIIERATKARYALLDQIRVDAMRDMFRSEFFHWNLNDHKLEHLGVCSLARLTKQVMKKVSAKMDDPLILIKPSPQGDLANPAILSIFYPNIEGELGEEDFMEYPICVGEHGAIRIAIQGNEDLAEREFYDPEELFKALRAEYPRCRILAYDSDMELAVQSVRKEIGEAATVAFMRARFLTAFFEGSGEKRVLTPEVKAAWGQKSCDEAETLAQPENREKLKVSVEEAYEMLRRD